MSGYLRLADIERSVEFIGRLFPSCATKHDLPFKTHEGRTVCALRLASAAKQPTRRVVITGGVHAREWMPPDMLVAWSWSLASAYVAKTKVAVGQGYEVSATEVQRLLDEMEIWVVPCVNPDGRAHTEADQNQRMWRKNRRPVTKHDTGVDINRNFDFVFDLRIDAGLPHTETYLGPFPKSEAETRNVQGLIEGLQPNGFLDVHSFSNVVGHPWGHEHNQTTDPTMRFTAQHPEMGKTEVRGMWTVPTDAYKEYIAPADLTWFSTSAQRMKKAIKLSDGISYNTGQAATKLYATSGSGEDFAYSRHISNITAAKTMGMLMEVGTKTSPETLKDFQPEYERALVEMRSAGAGVFEFCRTVLETPTEFFRPRLRIGPAPTLPGFFDPLREPLPEIFVPPPLEPPHLRGR